MSSVVAPTIGQGAMLRQCAEYLEARCDRLTMAGGELVWGASRAQVRAFVWAVFMGQDPRLALARKTYGARTWADLGPLAQAHVSALSAWMAEECPSTIPRRAAALVDGATAAGRRAA